MSEFKCLKYVLDKFGTDVAKDHRKEMNGRKVAGAIRSLVNAMGMQLECPMVLNEGLLKLVLMYGRDNGMDRKGEV